MLVITRRPRESFIIGKDTSVTILGVDKNQVKIGIRAPDGVKILRTELVLREKNSERR
jgi:carbon storage regulator